jgi:hypothetical protein
MRAREWNSTGERFGRKDSIPPPRRKGAEKAPRRTKKSLCVSLRLSAAVEKAEWIILSQRDLFKFNSSGINLEFSIFFGGNILALNPHWFFSIFDLNPFFEPN